MFKKSNTENSVGSAKTERRRLFWRKARRRTLWGLAIFITAHSALNIYASVQLNNALAAIRQKGEPLQFSELEPSAIPDAQNAALIYSKAHAALHLSSEEKFAFNTSIARRTAAETKLVEAALGRNQQAVSLARQAAAMSQCRFPLNWQGDPSNKNFPYLQELRDLSRLLSAQARLEASKQNTAAALQDVRAIFRISQHLSNEPVLLGFLVAQTIDGIANQALAQVLETASITVPVAQRFEASLPNTNWKQTYHRSLLGERTMSNYVFFRLEHTPAKSVVGLSARERSLLILAYPLYLIYQPFIKLDHACTLHFWDRLINSPSFQQIPRPLDAAEKFNEEIKSTPQYAMFTRLLMPVFSKSNDNLTREEVRARQREIALALATYHTAYNRYPTTLDGLKTINGKPLPEDIYTNKPFLYRTQDEGFLLYSAGINQTDDDGKGRLGLRGFQPGQDDILWGGSRD